MCIAFNRNTEGSHEGLTCIVRYTITFKNNVPRILLIRDVVRGGVISIIMTRTRTCHVRSFSATRLRTYIPPI